jgi:hypothetical protein
VDIPHFIYPVEVPSELGPFGAKGVESLRLFQLVRIANAIFDAVGVRNATPHPRVPFMAMK